MKGSRLTRLVSQAYSRSVKQVNMYEAKTHFSRLVAEALNGEEIVVARDGVPLIRLVPIVAPARPSLLGMMKGQIRMGPDFEEPLEDFADYQ